MAIDPGEFFGRFLQNYRSDSFAAWYIAKGGLSDHEAMETLATAAVCIGTVALTSTTPSTQVPDVDR